MIGQRIVDRPTLRLGETHRGRACHERHQVLRGIHAVGVAASILARAVERPLPVVTDLALETQHRAGALPLLEECRVRQILGIEIDGDGLAHEPRRHPGAERIERIGGREVHGRGDLREAVLGTEVAAAELAVEGELVRDEIVLERAIDAGTLFRTVDDGTTVARAEVGAIGRAAEAVRSQRIGLSRGEPGGDASETGVGIAGNSETARDGVDHDRAGCRGKGRNDILLKNGTSADRERGGLRVAIEGTLQEIAVVEVKRLGLFVGERQGKTGASFVEEASFIEAEAVLGSAAIGAGAERRGEVATGEVLAQDHIDDTANGAAAIHGGGGGRENLDTLDRSDGNTAEVGASGDVAALEPAPVDEDGGLGRGEAAQLDLGILERGTPRDLRVADLSLETDAAVVTGLRHEAHEFLQAGHPHAVDVDPADHVVVEDAGFRGGENSLVDGSVDLGRGHLHPLEFERAALSGRAFLRAAAPLGRPCGVWVGGPVHRQRSGLFILKHVQVRAGQHAIDGLERGELPLDLLRGDAADLFHGVDQFPARLFGKAFEGHDGVGGRKIVGFPRCVHRNEGWANAESQHPREQRAGKELKETVKVHRVVGGQAGLCSAREGRRGRFQTKQTNRIPVSVRKIPGPGRFLARISRPPQNQPVRLPLDADAKTPFQQTKKPLEVVGAETAAQPHFPEVPLAEHEWNRALAVELDEGFGQRCINKIKSADLPGEGRGHLSGGDRIHPGRRRARTGLDEQAFARADHRRAIGGRGGFGDGGRHLYPALGDQHFNGIRRQADVECRADGSNRHRPRLHDEGPGGVLRHGEVRLAADQQDAPLLRGKSDPHFGSPVQIDHRTILQDAPGCSCFPYR